MSAMPPSPSSDRTAIRPQPAQWGAEPVRIVNWLVEPGELVCAGDLLVEVGVPGVLGDVRATIDGRIAEICHAENAWIVPGTAIGWIEPSVPHEGDDGSAVDDDEAR